jgi:hypothetical protein
LLIVLIEGFAVNKKADPLIEHLNIPDFSRTFPPDVFTLQNFTPKVYPINCLVPAFFFAAKPTLNLKTQFLHLLLSLLSEIRSNVFPALPDGIIVYLIMFDHI